QARVYLKQGRRDKAEAWARQRGISLADPACYLAEYELLTLARLRLDDPGVYDLLERLLTLAETQKRLSSVLEILLTQALACQAQGHQPQALAALERALSLAAPQGYLRAFVDEGEEMRSLMVDFRQRGRSVLQIDKQSNHQLLGYVDKILLAFAQSGAAALQSASQNQKSEILSDRELEIVRLIAQGLSNTEISQRLYLALSTVKGHNQRIFDKLQVHNRTEAVARARELGLL
ncbi:MAG TPA: LuxR C-terminal-related transcriptional regulator, partial [Anaerolineales bacterium]|nr:LuxR C-terminal-related transcriptional regulator [Anaerolineales bacterium]